MVCGVHRSRDLKQVLRGCEGKEEVVEQCNADQGCGNSGKCVDGCTASALTKGSAGCDSWTIPPPTLRERGRIWIYWTYSARDLERAAPL
jgi:hypothetical protein